MRFHHASRAVVLSWLLLIAAAAFAATGCTSLRFHEVTRGRVVSVADGSARISLGAAEAVAVGQELTVRRVSRSPVPPKSGGVRRRTVVGRIRIDERLDPGLARATVLEGRVRAGDVVELVNPVDPQDPRP